MAKFQEGEAELIAQADRLEHFMAFKAMVERTRDEVRADLEDHPRVDNENVSRDWRYKNGYLSAIKYLLKLPQDARDSLQY